MRGALHPAVVRAIAKRDLRLYFSNPSGYVFVTLFIFLSAAAAFWQRRFFLNNLANLDQLNNYFPYLLLLFIPALTMGVWADERKQGTDELLLTLPASDLDVVLGKYLATVGVYSVSLLLSISHALVLVWLGSPDPGLMAANYLGYWLVGIALIAVGMVASLTTSNVTVAFILGSVLCSIPILIATTADLFAERFSGWIAPLGVNFHFLDFARGVIPLSGLLYFISVAAFFVYLNVLLVSRRHWPRRTVGAPMATHVAGRAVAVFVAVVAANVLIWRVPVRLDASAEGLHSLSTETRRMLQELPADRPVFVQAFISPEVPELYVQTRENMLSVLGEIRSRANRKVQVLITETVPYSKEARVARERFGINPNAVTDVNDPTGATDGIFLAVALTSGAEEQVIPFMDRGLSPEYEITRAIRVVARTSRKKVGVVTTDAKLLGGIDPDTGQPRAPWAVVRELSKQYDIVQISPSQRITEKVNALLVALPSTLLQYEMDYVKAAILEGVPSLVIIDPVTSMDMRLSPAAPMAERVNPYRSNDPVLRKNFGDVQKMMADLGVNWAPARIVWDSYNPHPDMSQLPREVVFVGKGSGSSEPFNGRHPATAGLQELMLLYGGALEPTDPAKFRFDALVRTGGLSGTVSYFQLVQPGPEGAVLNTGLLHEPDPKKQEYVLATHVQSQPGNQKVNAIVIADLDFISDQFFEIRAQGASNATFDNITFFLNSLDVLTGDSAFIDLRKRRLRHRTLERVEAQTRTFVERRTQEEQQAEAEAQKALADAESRRKKRIEEIQARGDVDEQAKQIMARNIDEVEKRKFDVLAANIQQAEQAKIQGIRENMESQVQRIQGTIRTIAVAAPPLPVLAMGILIFIRRRRREREGAAAVRRLRDVT
jgi:gliding motility-associated transport system permease protein/gliding motility-associatede transport system auxiliary component